MDKSPLIPDAYASKRPPLLIGREPLLRAILEHLVSGHKVLLTGPPGVGKSAVIQSLVASAPGRTLKRSLIVCNATCDARAIIEAAAAAFPVEQRSRPTEPDDVSERTLPIMRRKTVLRERRSAVYRGIQHGRWLVVLDHLSSRDPGIRRVLEFLFDFDVIALGATRGPRADHMGHAWKTVWRWQLIKVPPLAASASRALVEHLTTGWPMSDMAVETFRQRLLRLAEGNPGAIVEVCRRARQPGAKVDALRLWLDWLGEAAVPDE